MREVNTYLATEQVSGAVVSISYHVSCNDATRYPLTAGTYSEYNITGKIFDSDACAASTLSETARFSSKVCDESQYDDDGYYNDGMMHSTAFGQLDRTRFKDRLRHEKQHSRRLHSGHDDDEHTATPSSSSTRYSDYCLMANRAPSSSPSSRPSYGIGSPTPAPTVFKGVKFSASQVSEKSSISVCLHLSFDESHLSFHGSMLDSEWHHLVGVPRVAERVRRDSCEGYRELDEERPHHLQ